MPVKRIIHFLSLRKEPQDKQTSTGAQGWVRFDIGTVSVRMLQKFFNGKQKPQKPKVVRVYFFRFLFILRSLGIVIPTA